MKVRSLITLFLACTLAAAHTAPAHACGGDDPLTPDEEREARELAGTFARRFRETRDIAPLVGELFVKDFAARLQRGGDNFPTEFVARHVLARLTADELLSFYVAWANFIALMVEYWTFLDDAEDLPDGATETQKIEKLFPADAAAVLKEEPIIVVFFDEGARAGYARQAVGPGVTEEGGAAAEEEAGRFIKSAGQLHSMTSTIARAAPLMRAALSRLYAELPDGDPNAPREAGNPDAPRIHIASDYLLDTEAYGCPKGTRLIGVSVEYRPPFQFLVYIIRDGGRLRILNAVPQLDDD